MSDEPSVLDPLQKMEFEHKLDIEDKKYEDLWKVGCLMIDRRCLMYATQMLLISILMTFCLFKLSSDVLLSEDKNIYLSLLSLVIGVVIPSPKIK